MRLIDADALKKELAKNITIWTFNVSYDGILAEIIDNAPTVEPTYISDMPDDKVKDLQELAIDYGEGIAVFERKRPQGYWNYIQAGMAVCPFCGGTRRDNRIEHISFCNKCGAKMKGGAE